MQTAARIYVVGRPALDWSAAFAFLQEEAKGSLWLQDDGLVTDDSEDLCELAGRVCFMAFGENQGRRTNSAYLANIIASGHGSVLEHAVWNLIIAGISRSCSHELVRHRAGWSYSQLSQRYVDESDVEFVMPQAIAEHSDPKMRASWTQEMAQRRADYELLVERLLADLPADMSKRDKRIAARQAARSVLPNCTETKIFVTANARALRHFLLLRGAKAAEPEIRALAHQLLHVLQLEAKHLFGDLTLLDGEITCKS